MIPQPFPLVLPALASALSGWLKDDRLPPTFNYFLTILAFVVSVAACVAVGGGLSGNAGQDISLVIGECAAVFALIGPPLSKLPSPFMPRNPPPPSPIVEVPITPVTLRASLAQGMPIGAAAQAQQTAPSIASPPPPASPTGKASENTSTSST